MKKNLYYEPLLEFIDFDCLDVLSISDTIGDKWNDIAILCRSLGSNFRGEYGGKVYNGYSEDMLFERLGIAPDRKKMEYYRLLDELF